MKYEITIKNRSILLDKEDYEKFHNKKLSFSGTKNNYVVFWKNKRKVYLHREIVNCPDGLVVDHINHNTYDNRKENLRICTSSENTWNGSKMRRNSVSTSDYKNVSYHKDLDGWVSKLSKFGETVEYGVFSNEIAAANAYNHWAIKHYGDFAYLNNCPTMNEEEWLSYKRPKGVASQTCNYPYINWDDQHNKWRTVVRNKGKRYHLGRYDNIVEAVIDLNQFYIINDMINETKNDLRPKYIIIIEDEHLDLLSHDALNTYNKQLIYRNELLKNNQ